MSANLSVFKISAVVSSVPDAKVIFQLQEGTADKNDVLVGRPVRRCL